MLFTLLASSFGQQWQDQPEISALFENACVAGTFVVYAYEADLLIGHNYARAETRHIPASTFKIPNSIIGLATGAILNVDESLPYGDKPQMLKAWEKDMGLRDYQERCNRQ